MSAEVIDVRQIKHIHTLKSKLGWDNDMYRAVLAKYGVKTSKDLTWHLASKLIDELSKAAGQKVNSYRKRYAHENRDIQFASPLQKRMLEAMWKDVSYKKTDKERHRAFNRFLERLGYSHVQWVLRDDVGRVVHVLVAMGAKRPEDYLNNLEKENDNGKES